MKKIEDKLFWWAVRFCAAAVAAAMAVIAVHVIKECLPAFRQAGGQMFSLETGWRPVSSPPKFGLMPAITGTLCVSLLAVAIALLLGLGCAFLLTYYLPAGLAKALGALIDLLAGVPSVIFGFIGLTVVVKGFQTYLHMAAGQCILAAGLVLSVMLLPFVVATCKESVERARKKYEEAALALGFSKEMTILKIILPSIRTSVCSAAMMAFGRGLGETMAVMMVVGNSAVYPTLMGRGQTIASLTALEMGSITYGSLHLSVLYVANLVLAGILAAVLAGGWLLKRRAEAHE